MRLYLAILILAVCGSIGRTPNALAQPTFDDAPNLFQSAHHPTYFLLGRPDTKLQFSFRFRPVPSVPVYLAYTQMMFWQLFRVSAPFSDINFNPELFYRLDIENGIWRSIDLGIFDHHSNGKGAEDSRSWNTFYLRGNAEHRVSPGWKVSGSLMFNLIYGQERTIGDIRDYRGPVNLSIRGTWGREREIAYLELSAFPGGRWGEHPLKGGQELNFAYSWSEKPTLPKLHLQIYNGYAESQLTYNRSGFGVRAGISW